LGLIIIATYIYDSEAPTGTSFEVEGVSFAARRRTTGTATPVIAAGATRQVKISDGAGSTHSVSIEAVFRERRRSILDNYI